MLKRGPLQSASACLELEGVFFLFEIPWSAEPTFRRGEEVFFKAMLSLKEVSEWGLGPLSGACGSLNGCLGEARTARAARNCSPCPEDAFL